MPRKNQRPFTRKTPQEEIDDMPTDEEDVNEKLQNLYDNIANQKKEERKPKEKGNCHIFIKF